MMTNLKTLDISKKSAAPVPTYAFSASCLAYMTNLQSLKLGELPSVTKEHLSKLKKLKKLDLLGIKKFSQVELDRFYGKDLSVLKSLDSLQELKINACTDLFNFQLLREAYPKVLIKFYFTNGYYFGDFLGNKRHGICTWVSPGDHIYEGGFKDNKKEGKGFRKYLCTQNSGQDSCEGDFVNGTLHGVGTIHFLDGKSYKGFFEAGKSLKGKWYYSNGSTSSIGGYEDSEEANDKIDQDGDNQNDQGG